MISVFAEKEDQTGMADFVKIIGADAFFSILAELIRSGLDESFLAPHLKQAPSEKQILLKTGQELLALGRLELLLATLESCQWKEDEEVLLLLAKLLCLQSQVDEFCQFLATHKKVRLNVYGRYYLAFRLKLALYLLPRSIVPRQLRDTTNLRVSLRSSLL